MLKFIGIAVLALSFSAKAEVTNKQIADWYKEYFTKSVKAHQLQQKSNKLQKESDDLEQQANRLRGEARRALALANFYNRDHAQKAKHACDAARTDEKDAHEAANRAAGHKGSATALTKRLAESQRDEAAYRTALQAAAKGKEGDAQLADRLKREIAESDARQQLIKDAIERQNKLAGKQDAIAKNERASAAAHKADANKLKPGSCR